MKSKTKIKKQARKKKNTELVETIFLAKNHKKWLPIAQMLSTSTKKRLSLNLEEIDRMSNEKEIVVIPGKVLSLGEINKKIKIVALNFSEKTKEKLIKSKVPFSFIIDEIKENPEAGGIKVLK